MPDIFRRTVQWDDVGPTSVHESVHEAKSEAPCLASDGHLQTPTDT
jgi:hypothetical protein